MGRGWTPWPNTVPDGDLAFANRRILIVFDAKDGKIKKRMTTF
jgi:hypothetical protein